MRVSYRVSLIVAIPLLVLGTGALIAAQTFVASRRTVEELADGLFQKVADETVQRTRAHLAQAIPAVELLVHRQARAGASDGELLTDELVRVLETHEGFSWVTWSDARGAFRGVYRSAEGRVRRNRSAIGPDGNTVVDEDERDERGAWRAVHHESASRYDPRTRPYWQLARAARRRVWTPPYVFFHNAVPGITCAAPVVDGEGDAGVRGVFTIDFDLNRLSSFVAEMKLSPHGRVFVFTPDGKLVAHPTVRAVEQRTTGSAGELRTVASSGDLLVTGLVAHIDSAALAARDGAQQVRFRDGGVPYVARVASFAIDGKDRWLVGAVAPEADFLGPVQQATVTALAISGAALVGAVLLALILAGRVSRPLLDLSGEMERVGRFDLDERAQPRTIFIEIARMAEALDRMKRGLRSFASYVPRDLVRTLVASGREAKLGGETARLTMFFSDLAGFTTISEALAPDALVAQLGGYLDEMTRTIEAGGGTVDKFIGDGIMAFWGAPLPDERHAARACLAALRCQARLEAMRATEAGAWMRGVVTRIGIATGDVVVGNIGTPDRMNYTVMGDAVNLAARLESLSKQYGTLLLIDEATRAAAGEAVVARPVDVVAVKGKKTGVRVFELLAVAGEASPEIERVAAESAAGHAAYLARDFAEAERRYAAVLALRPDDGVARLFVERSSAFAAAPPPAGWDGTTVASEK